MGIWNICCTQGQWNEHSLSPRRAQVRACAVGSDWRRLGGRRDGLRCRRFHGVFVLLTIPIALRLDAARHFDPELWLRLEPALRSHYERTVTEYVEQQPGDLAIQSRRFGYLQGLRWVLEEAANLIKEAE